MVDDNECLHPSHGCQQMCINLPGTYTCQCHEGYRLNSDKHACDGMSSLLLCQLAAH